MDVQLFLAAQRIGTEVLNQVVPPPFSSSPTSSLEWKSRSDGSSFTLPLRNLQEVREILPCFSALSPSLYGYQFALEYLLPGEQHLRKAILEPVGEFPSSIGPSSSPREEDAAVESRIDLFSLKAPLEAARLRIDLFSPDPAALHRIPALLSVSLRKNGASVSSRNEVEERKIDLPVPSRSQMLLDSRISGRVCSPVSLFMVLGFHGHQTDVYQVIERTWHESTGLYGVWPANIHAASHWGMLGYLLHFPSWETARVLLDRGIPLIASIRYEKGELSRSPIPRSSGHLVVIRGYAGERVLVNDPAAPDDASVARDYALDEFLDVWLGRSAVGYVLFPGHQTSSTVSSNRLTISPK